MAPTTTPPHPIRYMSNLAILQTYLIHSANRCGLRCISHHLERYCHFGFPGHFFQPGPATLVGNTLSFTGAGSVVVEADQSGNDSYSAAPPVKQTIAVSKAPLTVTVANASVGYGNALPTFTSTVTGLVNGDEISDAQGSVHSLAARPALKGTVDGGGIDLTVTYSTNASSSAPTATSESIQSQRL